MTIQDTLCKLKRALGSKGLNAKLIVGIAMMAIAIMALAGRDIASSLPGNSQEDASSFAIEAPGQSDPHGEHEMICVHASGAVMSPGIVYLDAGSRVADAIEAAGGFAEDAARDSMNLARQLEDGEQVHVLTEAEYSATLSASEPVQARPSSGDASSDAPRTSETPVSGGSQSQGGLVNINTATSGELQSLSGIGESKAQKIIAYRESKGPFKSVDDLTKVSGIGEKTLESIRSSICV